MRRVDRAVSRPYNDVSESIIRLHNHCPSSPAAHTHIHTYIHTYMDIRSARNSLNQRRACRRNVLTPSVINQFNVNHTFGNDAGSTVARFARLSVRTRSTFGECLSIQFCLNAIRFDLNSEIDTG